LESVENGRVENREAKRRIMSNEGTYFLNQDFLIKIEIQRHSKYIATNHEID
jgi:hypothetical protein